MHQRRSGLNLGVMLLFSQMLNMGLNTIPPVTMALVVSQTVIFLDFLPEYFHSAASVCMSSYLVWHRRDWKRLIFSAFYHADDMHLYFNMLSLLIKGRSLEQRFGSSYFLWMVAVFTVLSSLGYIGINLLLEEFLHDQYYATQCAVGFSAVLFAMKVVTTHYAPHGMTYALGFIPVPSRYLYWVELLLIQMITPNASFTGHLSGILVGILYIKGPLKLIMDSVVSPFPGYSPNGYGQRTGYRRTTYYSRGQVGVERGNGHSADNQYSSFSGGLSEEEQFQRAMENSLREQQSSGLYPDLDELRQRREARFH